MNYIVVMTGGIGSGKSIISKKFSLLGAKIIDADIISKKILTFNKKIINIIVKHFGYNILNKNGVLNRKKIRKIIFNNCFEKKWLNTLLHPLIYKEIKKQLSYYYYPYVILVIPLFFEHKKQCPVNRILVIDTEPKTQINRIIKRDKITTKEAKKILSNQVNRNYRLKKANDIIFNKQNDIKLLNRNILNLHKKYLYLSCIKLTQ